MLGEWKDGVPRGAYHRVVQVRWQAAHIFVEPAASFRSAPWLPAGCMQFVGVTAATGTMHA